MFMYANGRLLLQSQKGKNETSGRAHSFGEYVSMYFKMRDLRFT